uniref:Syndetin C-terminal domain-containing protein n=1 Tax=Brassica oleracea var. oleracea TaxID=109376 RepID=A0A0D3DKM9_BRAOL
THTATLVPGLNFTCLRLHGRIEGNVNELCAQLEKSRPIKVESGNSNKKKRRSDYDSPHAAPVRRRYIDMNDDTDGGEDRIGVFRRKLSDDFDRIIYSSMRFSTNIESEQEHKIWDQWRIFRSLCAAVDTVSLVARILHKSKALLQSMLMSRNGSLVEDFFGQLVGSVPDLTEHLHMRTARILRHVNGKDVLQSKAHLQSMLMSRNGSLVEDFFGQLVGSVPDLTEHLHMTTARILRHVNGLAHGGIPQEVQNLLLEYGIEIFAETLVEGLSRIKICTDEGRALMSLDIQLYCTSLSSTNVKPKLQIVDTFIKAYYPPGMEYVHWARAHPVVGLVTLVATMKGWKRKTRLELVDKIEAAAA